MVTGVSTFDDLDPSESRISRSSDISVVNSTEIALYIGLAHKSHLMNRQATDHRIIGYLCCRQDNRPTLW